VLEQIPQPVRRATIRWGQLAADGHSIIICIHDRPSA
jgi:hypothetical protein